MNAVIGALIPLAFGVAVSPIPIVAAILILLSPRPRGNGVGFLIGWLIGIGAVLIIFTLVGSSLPPSNPDASRPVLGLVEIVLAVLLLLVAVRMWRRRPRGNATPTEPKWMGIIDRMTVWRAVLVGFILSAFNPVDTLLMISGGVTIGAARLGLGDVILSMVIFAVIGSVTVAVPVIGYLFASRHLDPTLLATKTWLLRYNAVMTAIMLLVVGTALLGKGIGNI